MRFGEHLKQQRQARDLTQPELAELIGIEQSYLSKLENEKSLPSAEILESILEALKVSLPQFLKGMEPQWIRKELSNIPAVNQFLESTKRASERKRASWVLLSALGCIFGITLLVSGHFAFVFPTTSYQYESPGIILNGESKDIFQNWRNAFHAELSALTFPSNAEEKEVTIKQRRAQKELEMIQRLDEVYLTSYEYQGEIYNVNVSGGSRTYRLLEHREVVRVENQLMMFLGTLLLTLGAFGFIVDWRLQKYR